ncbi:VWA domain-containing protein [Streptomyces sp. SID3343]|uniref:vWA domain-containing protein n=1 Tax=Streptomyces sp. SID3343 TaxID=2690260 RepID=UPI00137214B6|nr:VWA domain-containing protein [Streptomyces sp. SID3343]MYW01218.1 stress response protein [Streptomyces sp. SID3343]
MTNLAPGANMSIPETPLDIVLTWPVVAAGPTVEVCALFLGADGRVRGDEDFVFYNNPSGAGEAVVHGGSTSGVAALRIVPAALPSTVERVVVVASLDDSTFDAVPGLQARVDGGAGLIATIPTGDCDATAASVLAEVYRRGDVWKLRAVGQGYASGLAGLATDYGVDIGADPAPGADVSIDDLAALPPEMRERISLRKERVTVCLEEKGMAGLRAEVVLVLDKSGSMHDTYQNGTVARVVERLAPIAARMCTDGVLDAWLFADVPWRLPSVRIPDLPAWLAQVRDWDALAEISADIGVQNNEPAVIQALLTHYVPSPDGPPLLVLFFSDGGIIFNHGIEKLIRDAADRPVFWQFVGIGGQASFGALARLDDLTGRIVDNTDFFEISDVDTLTDDELYDRLLDEFPTWLAVARDKGVLRG